MQRKPKGCKRLVEVNNTYGNLPQQICTKLTGIYVAVDKISG